MDTHTITRTHTHTHTTAKHGVLLHLNPYEEANPVTQKNVTKLSSTAKPYALRFLLKLVHFIIIVIHMTIPLPQFSLCVCSLYKRLSFSKKVWVGGHLGHRHFVARYQGNFYNPKVSLCVTTLLCLERCKSTDTSDRV
jgi:hypothetical protein